MNITIPSSMNGATDVDVPQFAGIDILVVRRGLGFLSGDEYEVKSSGGFRLIKPGDKVVTDEVYTLVPSGFIIELKPVSYKVIQYPHILTVTIPEDAQQDGNGNWVNNSDPFVYQTTCRAEPTTGNKFITGSDGQQLTFRSIIYMPLPVQIIPDGALVEVYDGNRRIIRDDVKQFYKGQLNARAWV